MLEARCSLELSERVLTKQRKPEEAEEVMASGSSKKYLILVGQEN